MAVNIRELREKRAAAVAAMRAIVDAAEKEERELTQDEENQYARHNTDVDAFGERITREERLAGLEEELRESANGEANPARVRNPGGAPRRQDATDAPEYRSAMLRYLFNGAVNQNLRMDARADNINEELRSVLGTALSGTGSVLAPASFERALLDEITKVNVVRSLADVRSSNSDVDIPYASSHTQAYRIAEGADFTASTPAFAKLTMKAYKVGALSYVTHEALQDMLIDVEAWVRDDFARAFADFEEKDFITGTGSNAPQGVLVGGTSALTSAGATAITADELLALMYAVNAKYRKNGVFLLNDATALLLRKLKDANEQYIWQPSVQMGQPDMLFGKRVEYSDTMPVVAAGAKAVAFGDFKKFRILDRRGLFYQRLNEVAATSGQVGFLAYRRYDSRLIDAEAIKYITQKTT